MSTVVSIGMRVNLTRAVRLSQSTETMTAPKLNPTGDWYMTEAPGTISIRSMLGRVVGGVGGIGRLGSGIAPGIGRAVSAGCWLAGGVTGG